MRVRACACVTRKITEKTRKYYLVLLIAARLRRCDAAEASLRSGGRRLERSRIDRQAVQLRPEQLRHHCLGQRRALGLDRLPADAGLTAELDVVLDLWLGPAGLVAARTQDE